MPTRGHRLETPPGRDQIVFRRDLHVPGISCDDVNRMARALGERRLVGGVHAGSSERDGIRQHLATESLRRLGEEDGVPRDRLDDERAVGMTLDPFDRVVRFERGNRGAMRGGGVNRALDDLGAHERPCRVVDEHDLGRRIHARKGVRHRILTPRASGHNRQRPRGRSDIGLRVAREQIGGHDDHEIRHRRMRIERVDAAGQNRLASELQQLFGSGRTHPAPGAAGGNNGGHAHIRKR